MGPMIASAVATLGTMFVVLPGFLVGGLATFVREDIAFGAAGLGTAVATFFAASMVSAVPGGRFTERQGPERAIALATMIAGGCLLLVGMVVTSYPVLLVVLGLGGLANGVVHPAANLLVVRRVPRDRQGLAIGTKQAAILFATLASGLAVPAIALTVGWRWAFIAGGFVALAIAVVSTTASSSVVPARAGALRGGDVPTLPMIVLAVAAGLGAGTAVAMGSFLVDAVTRTGMAPSAAGWLLAAGSFVAALIRIGSGWVADRALPRPLAVVALMMIAGSVGLTVIQVGRPFFQIIGTLIGFGVGWGWHGLLNLAVVDANPNAPAAASAITEAGAFGGAVVMPVIFGVTASTWSFTASWFAGAAALLIAAILVIVVEPKLRARMTRRRAGLAPSAMSADASSRGGPAPVSERQHEEGEHGSPS